MKGRWPWWLLVVSIGIGVGLGLGWREPKATAVETQELFQAVDSWLRAAHVQEPDLPKAVLKVTTMANGHFLVHMQMQLGEGWFEVWKEGGKWQVKGTAPPRPPGPGSPR